MFNSAALGGILQSSPDTVTIIGMDPGTTTFGLGVLKVRIQDLTIVGVEAMTISGNHMPYFDTPDSWLLDVRSERALRIRTIMSQLGDLFDEYRPNYIAIEAPFMNMANPSAFGPLVETIFAAEQAALNHSPWRPFYRIETTVAKKAVYPKDPQLVAQYKILANARDAKGKKTSAKVKVQFCVRHDPELSPFVNLDVMDEHSVDAVVVAKAMLLKIRDGNLAF